VDDLDASVLLLPEIGLVDANDPRFRQCARPDRQRSAGVWDP
jgi:GH15 family glucan-1,4-alpha-glucosidase